MGVLILLIAALTWIGIAILVFFLWKIARFYEQSSGETVHSWIFPIPMLLLSAGAFVYLYQDTAFVGVPVGDLLLLGGGVTLLLASYLLQQAMVEER
jgi:hypothetical protein